jgi:hypothetical protein
MVLGVYGDMEPYIQKWAKETHTYGHEEKKGMRVN